METKMKNEMRVALWVMAAFLSVAAWNPGRAQSAENFSCRVKDNTITLESGGKTFLIQSGRTNTITIDGKTSYAAIQFKGHRAHLFAQEIKSIEVISDTPAEKAVKVVFSMAEEGPDKKWTEIPGLTMVLKVKVIKNLPCLFIDSQWVGAKKDIEKTFWVIWEQLKGRHAVCSNGKKVTFKNKWASVCKRGMQWILIQEKESSRSGLGLINNEKAILFQSPVPGGIAHLIQKRSWSDQSRQDFVMIPVDGGTAQMKCVANDIKRLAKSDKLAIMPAKKILFAGKTKSPPKIDGKLDDACWNNAAKASGFHKNDDTGTKSKWLTEAWLCYDKDNLYIAVKCKTPGKPLAKCKEQDGEVYNDDSVEVYIDTNHDHCEYYHFVANTISTRYDAHNIDPAWVSNWKSVASVVKGSWIAEIVIPWKDIAVKPAGGITLGLNICRNNQWIKREHSSWSPVMGGSFHVPANFGDLVLEDSPAWIKKVTPGKLYPGKNVLQVRAENRGDKSIEVVASLELSKPSEKTERFASKPVILAAGESKDISLPCKIAGQGNYQGRFRLATGKGTLCYRSASYPFVVADNFAKLRNIFSEMKQTVSTLELTGEIRRSLESNISVSANALNNLAAQYKSARQQRHWAMLVKVNRRITALNIKIGRLAAIVKSYKILAQRDEKPKTALEYSLGTEIAMRKIFREKAFSGKVTGTLQLSAAGNEYENAQLVIIPFEKDLKNVIVAAGDLVSEKGGVIPVTNITLSRVGYVQLKKISIATAHRGWWPDPLMDSGVFSVKKNQVQPIWVNVFVPAGTPKGKYTGWLKVKPANSHLSKIRFTVDVYGFDVPAKNHLTTSFWTHSGYLRVFYKLKRGSQEAANAYKRFCKFQLKYRLAMSPTLWKDEFVHQSTQLVKNVLQLQDSVVIGTYRARNYKPEKRKKYVAGLMKHFEKQIKLLETVEGVSRDKMYILPHDELQPRFFEACSEINRAIKKKYPEIRMPQTVWTGNPITHPKLDTKPLDWCLLTDWYDNNRKLIAAEKKKGKVIWWYVTASPHRPGTLIEQEALSPRILIWQCWKNRRIVSGLLYWGTIWWGDGPGRKRGGNSAVEPRWPKSPWIPNVWASANGNGYLIYPGPGMTPYSSIRLETFRDGMEDYEYFALLRDKIAKLEKAQGNAAKQLIDESRKLLEIDEKIVSSKTLSRHTRNPADIYAFRNKVARQIEKLAQALAKYPD